MENSKTRSSHTFIEQIKHINRSQSKKRTINKWYTELEKLWNELPKELTSHKDYLFRLFSYLQYNPDINKSSLYLPDVNRDIYPIASSTDFINYIIKFNSPMLYNPLFFSFKSALLQNTDCIQKIISLLLKIHKAEYQHFRSELQYHHLLNEKREKAYNQIAYQIGWPPEFIDIAFSSDNNNGIIQFENNLYFIPPHESNYVLFTPDSIKRYWSASNPKFSDKDCLLVWEYFKKFSYKLESTSVSYRPLCCASLDDNGTKLKNYELKYTIRTKKWKAKICSYPVGRDTLILFRQTISESDAYIRKDKILSYIFDFCGKSSSGLSFWSHYITDEISCSEKPNLFILYLNDDTEQELILAQLEILLMNPNLVNEAQDLRSLLEYGITPNVITAVPYTKPTKSITDLIQKLLACQTIEIPTSVSSIKLKYRCRKSVLIFCKHNKSPEDLKLFCRSKNIHIYEAVWSGFSAEAAPPSYPLLSGSCGNSSLNCPISLEPPEIAYVQWMLFIAKYHIAKQVLPQKQTPEEVLSKFMDKFCIVTGKKSDCLRSQEFYEQWVVDYYHQNNCIPIGYKRFNRFLKAYNEGQLYVKPIHKSTGDNVQHIIGLQFLESKYEKAKSEQVGNHIKKLQYFYDKLADLFDITEKEIQHVYQSIIENSSPE